MSLFDWVGAASAGGAGWAKTFDETFPGSFAVTFGDGHSAFVLGAQSTHVYGDTIRYTVDVEGFLLDGVLGKIPGLGHVLEAGGGVVPGLVAGAGGFVNFVFGNNSGVVYGPSTTVHRGKLTAITGLISPTFSDAEAKGKAGPQSTLDTAVQVITSALSLLMVGAGLTVEVLAATKFKASPPPPPPPGQDDDKKSVAEREKAAKEAAEKLAEYKGEEETKEKMRSVMKLLALGLTNRFMGLILAAERAGHHARKAAVTLAQVEQRLAVTEKRVADLTVALDQVRDDTKQRLDEAAEDAEETAEELAKAAQALVGGVKKTAEGAVQTGDLGHLAVGDFGVDADGDVTITGAKSVVRLAATGAKGSLELDAKRRACVTAGAAYLLLQDAAGYTPSALLTADEVRLLAGRYDLGSTASLTPTKLTLQLGVPDLGPAIVLSEGSIKLSVGGPEAASLTLTPAGITLRVGEVTQELTVGGITESVAECSREHTPEGHNLQAAEAVLNLGPEGIAVVTPTATTEHEAAKEVSATVLNTTAEVSSTLESALTIIE